MAEIICAECGTTNNGRTEFCSSCGAFLAWDGVADEPPLAAAAAAPAPAHSGSGRRPRRDGRSGSKPSAAPVAARIPLPDPGDRTRPGRPRRPRRPHRPHPYAPASRVSPTTPADTGGFGYTIKPPPGRAVAFEPAGADPRCSPGRSRPTAPPGSCPDCGTVNAPELRFCRRCGYQLYTAGSRSAESDHDRRSPEAAVVATVDPAELATGFRCCSARKPGARSGAVCRWAFGSAGGPTSAARSG